MGLREVSWGQREVGWSLRAITWGLREVTCELRGVTWGSIRSPGGSEKLLRVSEKSIGTEKGH